MSKVNQNEIRIISISNRWLANSGRIFAWFWSLFSISLLTWGWLNREEGYLSAERGLGYWLGIAGGSMMLLLLSYSVRKRTRLLNKFLKARFWFQFHMTLGILGPLCIIFHSNFHLGSLNSTVALICMLLVAGSGIVGRYLYTRIHFGLYGEKIRLQEIKKDFAILKNDFMKLAHTGKQQEIFDRLFSEITLLIEKQNSHQGFFSVRASRKRADKIATAFKTLTRQLEERYRRNTSTPVNLNELVDSLHRDSAIFLAVLRKLPGLLLFERMFSLWHVVHIPFFTLMIITSVTHVVVVHMY